MSDPHCPSAVRKALATDEDREAFRQMCDVIHDTETKRVRVTRFVQVFNELRDFVKSPTHDQPDAINARRAEVIGYCPLDPEHIALNPWKLRIALGRALSSINHWFRSSSYIPVAYDSPEFNLIDTRLPNLRKDPGGRRHWVVRRRLIFSPTASDTEGAFEEEQIRLNIESAKNSWPNPPVRHPKTGGAAVPAARPNPTAFEQYPPTDPIQIDADAITEQQWMVSQNWPEDY